MSRIHEQTEQAIISNGLDGRYHVAGQLPHCHVLIPRRDGGKVVADERRVERLELASEILWS